MIRRRDVKGPVTSSWLLAVALLALAGLAFATSVPGVFNLDENNYLCTLIGLRHGQLSLPGTANLSPSRALYWFDPWVEGRGAPSIPVYSTAPPLYAFLAFPFSLAGFRGLIALNVFSFAAATVAVYALARRLSSDPARGAQSALLAAVAFSLGGFALEYAQGAWPHMLAVALTAWASVAVVLTGRGASGAGPIGEAGSRQALLGGAAGLLVGLATGVRYQNAAYAGLLGLGVLLLARRKAWAAAGFGAGVAVPLFVAAWVNSIRLGLWNPISKGKGYLALDPTAANGSWLDVLVALWSEVVDFGAHPPIVLGLLHWGPDNVGAFVRGVAVKKAWLQSSPWILVALAVMVWAWLPASKSSVGRQPLRALSLVVGGVLAIFAAAGTSRNDGMCFNQRYFLELTPLAAVALAVGMEQVQVRWKALLAGSVPVGLVGAGAAIFSAPSGGRSLVLLTVPMALGVLLLGAWFFHRRSKVPASAVVALLGASIAWALVAHLGSDVAESRKMRRFSKEQYDLLAESIPGRSVYLSHDHLRDAAGPLLLTRDVIIIEPDHDAERTPELVRQLLNEGRRAFVDTFGMPKPILTVLQAEFATAIHVPGKDPILELSLR